MSMLAERRQKKQWSLNPKKTNWTEDSNKFGQKMLEKMGWKPGKGLGVNEQGIVTALRIKYKNDVKGLGCENKTDEWIKSQEEFNTLLGELGGDSVENNETDRVGERSLENISKSIRNRVHYHKFTRGKDLSKYTPKDLESILGINSNLRTKAKQEVNSGLLKYTSEDQVISDAAPDEICSKNNSLSETKLGKVKKKRLKSDRKKRIVKEEEDLTALKNQVEESCINIANDGSYVPKKKKKRKTHLQ